jgi:hypothetical protein
MLSPVIAAGTWTGNLISFLSTTLFAVCFEYSGLYYLWRFHVSNYPIARGARGVWKTCVERWNADGLAKRRENRSKYVERRRQLQEKILNDKRERKNIGQV